MRKRVQKTPDGTGSGRRKSADRWRHANLGRLLNNAIARFEGRILELMAQSGQVAVRQSHISLTRNLDIEGTRVSNLARRAGMTKQAMGELVAQCVALKLVASNVDPVDRRARIIRFTPQGLEWLDAFRKAVARTEKEMEREIGAEGVQGVRRALALYASQFDTLSGPPASSTLDK